MRSESPSSCFNREMGKGSGLVLVSLCLIGLLLCPACSQEWKGLPLLDETRDLTGTWKIRFDPDNEGKANQWMHAEAWQGGEAESDRSKAAASPDTGSDRDIAVLPPDTGSDRDIAVLPPDTESVRDIAILSPDAGPALDIKVPSAWETLPQGAGYDGVAWYMRTFSLPYDLPPGACAVLQFDAVNYGATVYLNGREVAYHEGAYAGFEVPLPEPEPGVRYVLVVRVADPGEERLDGMTLEEIPHAKESWYYNYGGIIGDVRLVIHGPLRLKEVFAAFTDPAGVSSDGRNEVGFTVESHNREILSEPVLARITISDLSGKKKYYHKEHALKCGVGETRFGWELRSMGSLEPWSPESPQLYNLEVFIEGKSFSQKERITFGARHFAMDESGFRLNGEPFFVRAVLYQPYYPGTLIVPPDAAWIKREVAQIKAAGFNMVRAHIRPAPQAFLDECDRVGLLVMAEPGIGWIKKETPEMRDRVMHEVESLVMTSRNHASIVWWGMLNELSGKVYPLRQELMQRTRDLDPTRLVTDDSAGWTGISLFLNPYEKEYGEYYDCHLYLNYPLTSQEWSTVKDLGTGGRGPVFISEFSFGGMTDLRGACRFFEEKPFLEDAGEYASFFDEAEQSLHSTPLSDSFSSWEEMRAIGEQVQAEAAQVVGSSLVNHPKVAGYCYTQFQDVSWEISAGMVDILGKPKRVYEALKTLNAMEREESGSIHRPGLLALASHAPPRNQKQQGTILGVKLQPQVKAFLEKRWKVTDLDGTVSNEEPAIVVSGGLLTLTKPVNVERLSRLYRFVAEGGVMLYLKPPRLDNELAFMKLSSGQEGVTVDLPVTLLYRKNTGGFIGKFHYVDPRYGFMGDFEAAPPYLGKGVGDIHPKSIHDPVDHEGVIVPVGSFDCYARFLGGHVMAVPYGKGYFVVNHLQLLDEMKGSHVARRLLDEIIGFSFDLAEKVVPVPPRLQAPAPELCDRISKSAHELRRVFALLDRLSGVSMAGGKRKKHTLIPLFDQVNPMRCKAIGLLAQGKLVDSAQAMEQLISVFSPEFKRFMEADEQFIKTFHTLPLVKQEDKTGKAIKGDRSEALRLLATGQEKEALVLLKATFDKLR